MSEMDVEEVKSSSQSSLLKSKSKESVSDEQGTRSKRVVFQEKPIILNKVSPKSSESAVKTESNENEKKEKKERNHPPTKVVIRRLPPTMTLESFIDHVSPLPEHDYIYFVRADMSLGPNAFSRAYINFVNMDDLLTFYEQFDNYVFMDNKGNEYPAVVEFAPFQRVPKKRVGRKKDPKVGTLKDDPVFLSFVASLEENKDTSSMKQASAEHLLTLTTESASKKDVTTPLLEFIKQRRAERQRVREEKREERKRKELERKRIKEEERKRRKDGDSVLKVLRNPDHEEKEELGKTGKERERSQQMMKKREEERKHREKERKDKRDLKGRDVPPKNYRDDRPKQLDSRMPRKIDDQRRKLPPDRLQIQNKGVDARHSQEFEKSGYSKDSDSRKVSSFVKDIDQKRGQNDKFTNHKDPDRYSRENDRKNYRDNDSRRSEKIYPQLKENDYRRGNYELRKVTHSFSESDTRRKISDKNIKISDMVPEYKPEISKSQSSDEADGKKWELQGAKPKRLISEEDVVVASESKSSDSEYKDTKDLGDHKQNSFVAQELDAIVLESNKCDMMKHGVLPGVLLKRRSSLESDTHDTKSTKPRRQTSLDSDTFFKDVCSDSSPKNVLLSRSQEFEKKHIETLHVARRSSLDSGDYKCRSSAYRIVDSTIVSSSKFKSDFNNLESEKNCSSESSTKADSDKSENASHSEKGMDYKLNYFEDQKHDKIKGEMLRSDDCRLTEGPGGDGNKRDPRVERRIRNKDRPSIEIYRPGMGRFSMQRKEREKNAGIGSSTEQESPSNSPSPTPIGRLVPNSKSIKTSQELRSMTFKRSVSREK